MGKVLDGLEDLTPPQVDELVAAFNETQELRGSFAFTGHRQFGPGLVSHLNRFGSRQFRRSTNELIEQVQ